MAHFNEHALNSIVDLIDRGRLVVESSGQVDGDSRRQTLGAVAAVVVRRFNGAVDGVRDLPPVKGDHPAIALDDTLYGLGRLDERHVERELGIIGPLPRPFATGIMSCVRFQTIR